MKISFLISIFLLFTIIIFGQEAVEAPKTPYQLKKNQHTITYSPIAFVGYKYANRFNKNLILGVGLSLGVRTFGLPPLHEIAKLSIFYRKFIREKTYLNLGAFASLDTEGQPFRGFEGEIFYGWNRFKIGQAIQIGYFDDQMSDNGGEEFGFAINLLILQINL